MPTTLVTGGTGFIGAHVVRALVARGDPVRVTVRAGSDLEALAGVDVETVQADVTDPAAVARAVRGVDRVVHAAGSTRLRDPRERLWEANVTSVRVVMDACLHAGVERVVHVSSVAALGPAPRGSTADEDQVPRPEDLAGIPYAAAKLAGEREALAAAERGLPVVVVQPAHVLGPGDRGRSSTDVVRRFLLRRIPAYVDGAINVVDVRDVAAGILLAADEGRPGERYILGDRNYTWERLFADLGRLSGIEPPAVRLPASLAEAIAGASGVVALPPPLGGLVHPAEVRAAARYWTYRSTRARRELGWTTRPHEETVESTVAWWRERLGDRVVPTRQPVVLRLTGAWLRGAGDLANRLTR